MDNLIAKQLIEQGQEQQRQIQELQWRLEETEIRLANARTYYLTQRVTTLERRTRYVRQPLPHYSAVSRYAPMPGFNYMGYRYK